MTFSCVTFSRAFLCGCAAALTAISLSGCTTPAVSNPARTATEQLLISTAAERAAERLSVTIAPDAKIFLDNTNFEGTDSKYAIGAIRTALLEKGAHLIDDKKTADVVIETRAGALSTDRSNFLVGVPAFSVPVPFASSPLGIPELAFYGSDRQIGVAKFAITAYDAKKGALVAAQPPQYGFAHNDKKTLLLFISWTDADMLPDDVSEDEDAAKAYRDITTPTPKVPIGGPPADTAAPATGTATSHHIPLSY